MRIEELLLVAFGRFRGLELRFEPGLNVVFGPNESGKSTIVRFVRCMLYGIAKPGLKQRREREELELCKPWSGGECRGRMIVALDGGARLRVERSFDPHAVRILDENTCAEEVLTFDTRREPTFFAERLSLSEVEFESTACVGQLEVGAIGRNDETVRALATRMASPRGTRDPAQKALERLGRRLEEIGSERAPTRPYARTRAELERARERVRELARVQAENLARELERKRLEEEIAAMQTRLSSIDEELASAEGRELREALLQLELLAGEAAGLLARLPAIERELASFEPVSSVLLEEVEKLRPLLSEYRERKQAEERLSADLTRREAALSALEARRAALGVACDARATLSRLEELERAVAGMGQELARHDLGLAAPAGAAKALAATAVLVASVVLGLAASEWFFLGALGALPVAVVLAAKAWRVARNRAAAARARQALAARLRSAEDELAAVVRAAGASDAQALGRRLAEALDLDDEIGRARSALDALRCQGPPPSAEKLDELLGLLRRASPMSDRIRRAVESREVERADVEEFISLHRGFAKASNELAAARAALADSWARAGELAQSLARRVDWAGPVLEACRAKDAQRLLAELAAAKGRLPPEPPAPAPSRSVEAIRAERTELEQRLTASRARLDTLVGKLEEAYRGLESVGDLIGRQEELERKLAHMELERRALERASTTMRSVADEMRRQFAPRLAARLAPMARAITGGRYADVKVGEGLELAVLTPEDGSPRSVRVLSQGASDQLHFALRLAAALELTEGRERVPIICDDTLAQFDDERALACLEFLARNVAPERQVVLLTCRRRERDAAERLGANLIELGGRGHFEMRLSG